MNTKRPLIALAHPAQARLMAVAASAGLTLLSCPRTGLAADPTTDKKPPGSVPAFTAALAHFDLHTPIGDGTGVVEIRTLTSDPSKGFAAEPGYGRYFWAAGTTQMIFLVPPNGATTPNSHDPRTELAQKKGERWKIRSGDHTLRGTFSLAAVPEITDKGEITVAQIHNQISDNGPLLKLMIDYNARPWKLHADYRIEPKKSSDQIRTPAKQRVSMALNSPMEFEITLTIARVLTVKARQSGKKPWSMLADSKQKGQSLAAAWDEETCYFKAGCYMHDRGPAAAPAGEIRYTKLSVE